MTTPSEESADSGKQERVGPAPKGSPTRGPTPTGAVLYFGSGAKREFLALSNLHRNPVTLEGGKHYPSVEHAFQELKFQCSEWTFRAGGLLDSDEGFQLVFGKHWLKKKSWWLGKKECIGILAKMFASHRKINEKVTGIQRRTDFQSDWETWKPLLLAKFQQNGDCRRALLATKGAYLCEYDRMAHSQVSKGKPGPYWAGSVVDGKLYGKNVMGQYLMRVRDLLGE